MGIELKTVNPVVFDDPVYCASKEKKCRYLDIEENSCSLLFYSQKPGYLEKTPLDSKWFNNHESYWPIHIKCQECKDHYQKAKEIKPVKLDEEYCKNCNEYHHCTEHCENVPLLKK